MAERIGIISSIIITEAVTGLGILYLCCSPLSGIFPLLPLLGIALNGTSSVLYGTGPNLIRLPMCRVSLVSFNTASLVASAMAPPIFGLLAMPLG